MNIVVFVHAVTSCWNNGNAHFLRGLGRALAARGHRLRYAEAEGNWSEANLLREQGCDAFAACRAATADLDVVRYDPVRLDLPALTEGADLVLVHEWNAPQLVAALGTLRKAGAGFRLLFHDTHHRAATAPGELGRNDLSGYDGVLAFGETVAEIYRKRGWGRRVWTFHEAADTSLFRPRDPETGARDLVWIGNWGDEERSRELREFLIEPAFALSLAADIHGVRYPQAAQRELAAKEIRFAGWLPNHAVPRAFAAHRFTVHVPRRPYARALPGIPTIRVFEALASGIPLISAPWIDSENLFPEGCYLKAADGEAMRRHMRALLCDAALAGDLRQKGLAAIANGHSCEARARQLETICAQLGGHCQQKDVA